jgi:outer membrane receptor for ferrienterochelin and colicins
MKHIIMLALVLIPLTAIAQNTPPPPQQHEEKELEELLTIVNQETEIATKTKMNSDYVPGIVSVLEGDEIEALGIATAGEALGMVPGMFASTDRLGNRSVTVRGLDFPFNSGNILILLNGIAISRPDGGINTAALLIPSEQIERIEVIRGPGSVVYGDFAFMGLVNIVTRKEGSRVFARADSPHSNLGLGARFSSKGFTANVSRSTSNDFADSIPLHGADDARTFGMASYDRGGLSLAAQSVQRTYDGHQNGARFEEDTWVLNAAYSRAINSSLRSSVHGTYLSNDLNDFTSQFNGHLLKIGVDAVWNGSHNNTLLAGVDYTSSIIADASHRLPPAPGQPIGNPVPLVHDADRQISGIYVQDRIDLRDRLSLTIGGRYDSYSDLQSRFTPRVAIAWRLNDQNIIKAQYAEGFRPPTFFELYSPVPPGVIPRYYFETNATTELNYVYRTPAQVWRVTAFHEVLTNMIRPGGFITDPNAQADGGELEWSRQIGRPFKLDANVSYVETIDPRIAGPGFPRRINPVSPRWLGNVSLFYRPVRGIVLGARVTHAGDRELGRNMDFFDVTLSKEDLFTRGLTLRLGVKNAFNGAVTYVFLPPVGPSQTNTFPARSVWLQASWKR